MSCYESEWGNITFTKIGYMQVVREFRKAYNEHIKHIYAINDALHTHLSTIKGAGSTKKRLDAFFAAQYSSPIGDYKLGLRKGDEIMEYKAVFYTVKDEMFRGKGNTLTKPRRQAFPTLTNKQAEFAVDAGQEGSLTFSLTSDGGNVRWYVEENNHSVDQAHQSVVYRIFMKVLRGYKWKRQEGGVFYYESEYTRCGAKESGCGDTSSETAHFGPVGKKHQEVKIKMLSAMYR